MMAAEIIFVDRATPALVRCSCDNGANVSKNNFVSNASLLSILLRMEARG